MSNVTRLVCISCQKQYQPEKIDYTCPQCGPIHGTLEVLYDYHKVKTELSRTGLFNNREMSHWRYLPLLPVSKPEFIQPLAVGWTPVYRSKSLENKLQLAGVWIKDDGRNPTSSLKDRASAVGVVKALEKGCRIVTAASTGNAASSWAAFTRVAGFTTVIFVPENAPRAKLTQLLIYGAHVMQVKGSYDDAFELCCQAAEKWGWYNRSTAINPYLGEGKKTAALELCEQLNWQVPDYVLVSVGDGCIFQGMWKGFREFKEIGLIDRCPRLIGVQAAGSAPLVKAWQEDKSVATAMIPETVADSISVGIPRDQVKALKAVRASQGQLIAVSDTEILSALSELALQTGVCAEPAGAAAMAGLIKLVHSGVIKKHETAAVIVTGNGLKDIDGVLKAATLTPAQVNNSLDDVAKKLPALTL